MLIRTARSLSVLLVIVLIQACSQTSTPGTSSTSLADSMAGVWHVREIAYAGWLGGQGFSRDTLDFIDTITRANDSTLHFYTTTRYHNLAWHFTSGYYSINAQKRTIGFPGTTVGGRIVSADSFIVSGEYVAAGTDSDTHWNGWYGK